MAEQFERHSRTFSLLTLASRVTGLVRDAAMSRVFGAGGVMDAFFLAFIIPNLFRRLFGEGAVSAAFLRAYAQLDRNDPAQARRLATLTVGLLLVILGGLTLAAELVLLVISSRHGHDNLALRLTMIMLPYMPMVCVVAILGAMLQVHGRFGPTAAAPIVLNACLIGVVIGMAPLYGEDPMGHVVAAAAAVVFAGALQVIWMLWALRGRRWLVRDVAAGRGPMRAVMLQAAPMILGLGVIQLNAFFDSLIASYPTIVSAGGADPASPATIFGIVYPLETGALAAVSFAQRLYQFPLGVFGIAVATAIYPALARQADDQEAFVHTLRRGLRLVVFIGLPASVGLMAVAPMLVTVIYKGGHFGTDDSQRVAFVLLGYAAGVWAYSMIHVMTRAFYAKGDSRTPVRVALWMVGLNLALNCTLIWTPLREAALAWSTALCATLQAFILLALLRRHTTRLVDRPVVSGLLRSVVATAVMTVVVVVIMAALPEAVTWKQSCVSLAVTISAGLTVVVAFAAILRMPELSWALGRNRN